MSQSSHPPIFPPTLIREFEPGDIVRLHEIDAICFEPGIAYSRAELTFYLRRPGSVVRIAERTKEIVGFAIGIIEVDLCAHVITLDVLPQARRGGAGTRLLGCLHKEFRSAGALRATLEVDVANEAAHAFYERFGYRRIKLLRGYYGRGRDAYSMECRL
jgi:[ribosomal protein S18]-alanine N-acetyltransferase